MRLAHCNANARLRVPKRIRYSVSVCHERIPAKPAKRDGVKLRDHERAMSDKRRCEIVDRWAISKKKSQPI